MPGSEPSQSPSICYRMWSGCSYPVLFEGVSQSDMKAAFRLWFQELGQPLPDALVSDESEDSSSDDDTSYECSSDDEQSLSDAEYETESESDTSSNASVLPAAAGDPRSSYPSPASPGSPYAFLDVESASSTSDTYDGDGDDADSLPPNDLGPLSKPSSASPSPSVEPEDDLFLALMYDGYSQLETGTCDLIEGASNDGNGNAAADEWILELKAARTLPECESMSYQAPSLFDVLNEDRVPSPVANDDNDSLYSLVPTDFCFDTSSRSSSQGYVGSYFGEASGEEDSDHGLLAADVFAEYLDDAAATVSNDESLSLGSILELEELLSTIDAAEEPGPLQCASESARPLSESASQPLTSSAPTRGKKRARELEDETDYAATAGPSTKVC